MEKEIKINELRQMYIIIVRLDLKRGMAIGLHYISVLKSW